MTKGGRTERIAERDKSKVSKAALGEWRKLARTERIIMIWAAAGTFVVFGLLRWPSPRDGQEKKKTPYLLGA